MNILTKQRILEKGDEVYSSSGEWKPIPDSEIGLQIMFSKYGNMQIRRPSEEPPKTLPETPETVIHGRTEVRECAVSPTPSTMGTLLSMAAKQISPDSSTALADTPEITGPVAETAAESENITLVPTHSGTRVLPTVVSEKAHIEVKATYDHTGRAPFPPIPTGVLTIPFPDKSPSTQWIGRNGTFYSKGVHLNVIEEADEKDNIIQIRPVGSRGLAKNALIEFPASIIPQVVDWLLRMQTTPK